MSAFTLVYTRAMFLNWTSSDVDIPFPNVVKTGNATNTVTGQLKDSGANFSGIQVGDIVLDSSSNVPAYVVGIVDNTTLLLSADIFVTGDQYVIYQGQNYGCYIYIPFVDYITEGAQSIQVETIGGDIVQFQNPPAGILPVQVRKLISSDLTVKLLALW